MAKYFLSKKAVEDISKIWNYTYEFWSDIKRISIMSSSFKPVKKLLINQK